MAKKEKQIQEVEIRVSVEGDKTAEASLNKLEKKKKDMARSNSKIIDDESVSNKKLYDSRRKTWEKEFNLLRKEKLAREESLRKNSKINRRKLWEEEFVRMRSGKSERERIFNLKRSIKNRLGSGRGNGYSSLDNYRKSTLLEKRKSDWALEFEQMRADKTARESSFRADRMSNRDVAWREEFERMRAPKLRREEFARNTIYNKGKVSSVSEIKDSIQEKIAKKDMLNEKKKEAVVNKQVASSTESTNKKLRDRILLEKRISKETRKADAIRKRSGNINKNHEAGRRSGGGVIGKAMLYLGFGMMSQYVLGAGIGMASALGDASASAESNIFKGNAARESYSKRGNVDDFDNAVKLYSSLTGQNKYASRSRLGEITGALEASGISIKGDQLSGVARGIRGLSGGMGITEEMASQKMLGLLSGRISAQEAGLVGVKRSSDPNKTLERILAFLEKNSVTSAVMREGTIDSLMERIRSAPSGLLSSLYERSPDLVKGGFESLAGWIDRFFGKDNPRVVEYWAKTWKQFEEMSVEVFGANAEETARRITKATAFAIKGIETYALWIKNIIEVGSTPGKLFDESMELERMNYMSDILKENLERKKRGEKELPLVDKRTEDQVIIDAVERAIGHALDIEFQKEPATMKDIVNSVFMNDASAFKMLVDLKDYYFGGEDETNAGRTIIIKDSNVTIDKEGKIIKSDNMINEGEF